MNLRPTLLAASLALAAGTLALAPAMATAAVPTTPATGTVTISGTVYDTTCSVSNGSSGNITVALPSVTAATLSGAGVTAQPTAFSLMLTGCPVSTTGAKVGATFTTSNADATTGNGTMNNTGVANVDVQLLASGGAPGTTAATATSGGTAVKYDGSTVTSLTSTDASGNAVLGYYAQYYATAAVTATGNVSATATYTLSYQ